MEPVGAWGPAQAAAWLRGLDAAVQGYPFEEWGLAGTELLGLSAAALEVLGVWRVGHQELLLEAVEQLRALDTELASTSLQTLAEGLRDLAQRAQTLVMERPPGGAALQQPQFSLLACVVDLIRAAKELFSWLNRYLFSTLNDFSATRDIVLLCARLAEVLQTVGGRTATRPRGWAGGREGSQELSHPLKLFCAAGGEIWGEGGCVPAHRGPLPLQGLEITSTSSCLHFVSTTTSEALAAHGGRILPGDEIVQVNEQVVVSATNQVGWTRVNLVKKLLEKASGVTLVLKKVPLSLPSSPLPARQQVPGDVLDAADPYGPKNSECPPSPVSRGPSPPSTDVDSGPDPATDDEDERDTSLHGEDAGELPLAPLSHGMGGAEGKGSFPHPTHEAPQNAAGVATRLSRRRVSCRDLGRVDCDGWLLKKKDHAGFMAQKWKRCWFVLKGHTLYWYNHPNDDKAAGLINVATYDLESTREQKKKYVFQLSHERYKPFIFAAETLADLSMWVSHLITAKTKHALAHQPVPQREEDCYSETEAEDPDDESPRHGCDSVSDPKGHPGEGQELLLSPPAPVSGPPHSTVPISHPDPFEEDLESLMWCLRQGGVSLIGRQRFLTQEQCRKSFIRRNKNPRINEKVHVVRALQSTLKAKLAELQALEQLLDDAALTSEKFRRWKEEHQDLYQELQEWWARRQGQDGSGDHEAEQSPPAEAAEP
ncbi:CNKR1 kinase, partial [Penelope pileata]|nr:CNKR1 kinase [Penelope pileata]